MKSHEIWTNKVSVHAGSDGGVASGRGGREAGENPILVHLAEIWVKKEK
jgi:hypothetical protein